VSASVRSSDLPKPSDDAAVVHVRPGGAVIAVRPGETLMTAARRQGYRWPSICGGKASCTTCFVQIVEGRAAVLPMEQPEYTALEFLRHKFAADPDRVRLACQLHIQRDGVVVLRPGVRLQGPPAGGRTS
jgi:ferredoxin, 2Fe-2S